ncbi:MAG: GNAT family N-acetyltransferase [Rhodospirillales bacterium]|nr:GNAT family N-acetyltransferase [Rhodospirillales bacterium]
MPTTGVNDPSRPAFSPLATKRLRLRPFALDDAPSVQHFLGNEDLAKQTVNLPYPFEAGAAETWLRSTLDDLQNGGGYTLAMERREDKALMGAVGLLVDPVVGTRAELGYWIARTYWGIGLATEAVERMIGFGRIELGIKEIWACAFSENTASIRVLEKTGFQQNFSRDEQCPGRGGQRSITYFGLP